eukprot:scaffold432337_cov32-Prasinocladus_malaysianus.AAC.1
MHIVDLGHKQLSDITVKDSPTRPATAQFLQGNVTMKGSWCVMYAAKGVIRWMHQHDLLLSARPTLFVSSSDTHLYTAQPGDDMYISITTASCVQPFLRQRCHVSLNDVADARSRSYQNANA